MPALIDEHRQIQFHGKRVVASGVLVELEAHAPRAPVRVVKDLERGVPPPLVDAVIAELAEAVTPEIEGWRKQDETIHPSRHVARRGVDGQIRAEARADESDRSLGRVSNRACR